MEVGRKRLSGGRNPGPRWGYRFLVEAATWLPGPVFRGGLWLGTAVGVAAMPRQRRTSAAYLRQVLERPVRWRDLIGHFYAFSSTLLKTLRVARGKPLHLFFREGEGADFEMVSREDTPVLYGTFHLGDGDLLGYFLGRFGRPVKMVRLRVGNSDETRWMEEQFGDSVGFIWVDQPENMTFAIREALEAGHSLAMKCDRVEGARKTERFLFLGREREFPFTIYWLSWLFRVPVLFSFGVGQPDGSTEVRASRAFLPDPSRSRLEHLERAREHFRGVLEMAEQILRANPALWFNFTGGDGSDRREELG